MTKLHNIWAVICFLMSCAFFVLGRWSVLSEGNPHSQAALIAQEDQNAAQISRERSTAEGSIRESSGYEVALKNETNSPPFPKPRSIEQMDTSALPPLSPPEDIPAITDRNSFLGPQQSPEIAAMEEKDNEALREEMAHTLRNQGVSEEAITAQLEEYFPPLSRTEALDPEQPAVLSPEQQAEQYASALQESGVPDEEIDQVMEGFISALEPQETAEQ